MGKNNLQKGKIVIYKSPKNEVEVRVRFDEETAWLKQNEIAKILQTVDQKIEIERKKKLFMKSYLNQY